MSGRKGCPIQGSWISLCLASQGQRQCAKSVHPLIGSRTLLSLRMFIIRNHNFKKTGFVFFSKFFCIFQGCPQMARFVYFSIFFCILIYLAESSTLQVRAHHGPSRGLGNALKAAFQLPAADLKRAKADCPSRRPQKTHVRMTRKARLANDDFSKTCLNRGPMEFSF